MKHIESKAYLELFVHPCSSIRPWGHQLVHVRMQLSHCHLCLTRQDGFHQGIVDKNILFLQKEKNRTFKFVIETFLTAS